MTDNVSELDGIKSSGSRRYKYSEEQRKKYFQDYKESGLSVKEYCQLNSISKSALNKWKHKFRSKPAFAPVIQKCAASLVSNSNKQSFEIIFMSGLRIRIPELVNISAVKQLIKEIESCSSK